MRREPCQCLAHQALPPSSTPFHLPVHELLLTTISAPGATPTHYTHIEEDISSANGKPYLAPSAPRQPPMDTHQAFETANTSNNRHEPKSIRMKRAHDPRAKVVTPGDDSHQFGGPVRPPPRPIPTIAEIDAETHHILPEESRFGLEFKNRAAPWKESYSGADTHATGAFTVWGPETVDLPEESRPYATDASRLDSNIVKEEERQARAMSKGSQLIRHGLVVDHHHHLRPLLALPNVSHKEQERRRQNAQRLIDQYVYESSEDDAAASQPPNESRKKPKKGRLVKLTQALAKLEIPVVSNEQDEPRPTLGFQKAMRNPSHPDFGMDFTAALRLAMAEEKKAHISTKPDKVWDSDDDGSDTTVLAARRRGTSVRLGQATRAPRARPRPRSRRHSSSRAEINGQRKYDVVEHTVAKASEMGGLDFRDERLVDIFNGIMQQDNPRRPIRSQASLLAISYTDPLEYFGEDLQTLLESEAYSEQVGSAAAARLLPHSRLS